MSNELTNTAWLGTPSFLTACPNYK